MKMKTKNQDFQRPKPFTRGFALVATLTLMALIMIIAVGMLSLSSISLRIATQTDAMLEAQANARMALMIAIGELQKQMGPDKRISARGATLAKHPAFGTPVAASGAKAWWVGAASSNATETIGSNNQPVVWLLSGLDQTASSADQIAAPSPFKQEITLFGNNSIDLTLTGGTPITAGAVPIMDSKGKNTGLYAYFIEDNGMKAQLAASDPKLINDDSAATRVGGTVLPGSFDLSILDGMNLMQGVPASEYVKLPSYNSLSLLGNGNGGNQVTQNKRLAYTTRSLGVLSDVKKGGLKKDLTIAFENHEINPEQARHPEVGDPKVRYPNWPVYTVFDNVFKKNFDDSSGKDSNWDEYLVVDESKWSEFGANGYIHWAMFRDYYNLKRYIRRAPVSYGSAARSMDYLDPIVIHNATFSSSGGGFKSYGRGIVPPHEMGPDNPIEGGSAFFERSDDFMARSEGMPYGNYRTWPNSSYLAYGKEFIEYYKHSPILPVTSRIQLNVWIEQGVIQNTTADPSNIDAVKTNAQSFTSLYNPYNIGMRYHAPEGTTSINFSGLPQAMVFIPKATFDFDPYLPNGNNNPGHVTTHSAWDALQTQGATGHDRTFRIDKAGVFVDPGRGLVAALSKDVQGGRIMHDGAIDYAFKDVIDKSIYMNYDTKDSTAGKTFPIEVRVSDGGMNFGVASTTIIGGAYAVSQYHWGTFAKEPIKMQHHFDVPGVNIKVPEASLGPNTMASFSLKLRSTTEADANSLRPLVDANIRGFYFNPRWDSPLGLDTSAAYIIDDDPLMGQVPQMVTSKDASGLPTGFTYWGASDYPLDGYDRVILFDIPRQDLVSLGQLQHANAGRFSYEPSYIAGNSYANPRISKDSWKNDSVTDTYATSARGFRPGTAIPGPFTLYDASYLVNETLWDSYIFTTIPQFADDWKGTLNATPVAENDPALFTALLKREKLLPNPRFIPYEPAGSSFNAATLQEPGSDAIQSAFHHNAGHLLVDGSFNVNSTSVDAWEAFLSGTYGMPYEKLDVKGQVTTGYEMPSDPLRLVRFPRVQSVFGGAMLDSPDDNYWIGFRALKNTEVRELAIEIVNQIKERGPFLTLGDFVNRKLINSELGDKGALQAALDKTVNKNPSSLYSSSAKHSALPNGENQAAGFPGQLLQGDLLQALSPMMTVRSDTFTIRAYGESISPVTGETQAKAWCEAVVQRMPDPVAPDPSKPLLVELAQPSSIFGREFRVISFRWLNEKEI